MISENCWNVNLTQVFLSSHITRSVRCWSLFKAHESLLVYQFLALVKLGSFHISEKGFYLDKFSCHHRHFTSAAGLFRLDKFWPKRTNLQTHRHRIFKFQDRTPLFCWYFVDSWVSLTIKNDETSQLYWTGEKGSRWQSCETDIALHPHTQTDRNFPNLLLHLLSGFFSAFFPLSFRQS